LHRPDHGVDFSLTDHATTEHVGPVIEPRVGNKTESSIRGNRLDHQLDVAGPQPPIAVNIRKVWR
jgi:hypothetical protein